MDGGGMPVSGKPWKRGSQRMGRGKSGQLSWKLRQEQKAQKKALQTRIAELKEQKQARSRAEKRAKQERAKIKELNKARSTEVQRIKDQARIKKWPKKAKRLLTKLPPEIFYERFA